MRHALARISPGTPLRDGIDRVVRAKAGALLVLDDGPDVLSICSGGFLVDAPYSPQRLSELAKMDGAIIISGDGGRIARANVHLVPDPTVPTSETGTRHRTAERVARSLAVPVVSASEEMGVINVYAGGGKRQLQEIGRLLERANQALQTLERYKIRLDDAIASLTAVEVEDVATLRDVAAVVQRGEMVHRIADEIETDDRRARRRRPAAAPPAGRAVRRDRRRARPGRAGLRRRRPHRSRDPRRACRASPTTRSTISGWPPRRCTGLDDTDDLATSVTPRGLAAPAPDQASVVGVGRSDRRALRRPLEAPARHDRRPVAGRRHRRRPPLPKSARRWHA